MMNLVAVLCLLQCYEVFCYPPRDGNPPMFDNPFMIDDGLGPIQPPWMPVGVEGNVNVNIKSGGKKVKYDMDIVIDAGDPCCGENHAGGHGDPCCGKNHTGGHDIGDGGSTDTSIPVDPCASIFCNNGNCVTHDNDSHSCVCDDGYVGSTCETLDHCHLDPCLHTGNCSSTDNGHSCECHSHFQGENCEDFNFTLNGKIYVLGQQMLSWDGAKEACGDIGGQFAFLTIEDYLEVVLPVKGIIDLSPYIFVGAMEDPTHGVIDIFGRPTIVIDSPVEDVDGNCFTIFEVGNPVFGNNNCSSPLNFFCEI